MSFDPTILDLMQVQAIYYPFVANNLYGEPSFGTPVPFNCHITYKRKILRSDTEQDVTSTAQLQMPPGGYVVNGTTTPTITVDDRVSLPLDGIQRKVLDVTTFTDNDPSEINHQSLYIE